MDDADWSASTGGGSAVAGRFPELGRLEALSALEWDALRSLNVACAELRQEFDAAQTRASGVLLKHDVAEDYAGPDPLQRSHCAALGEVATLAVRYEDQVGALTWRYASASFVLGVAVMDRLLRGDAPLPREHVVRLCGEPSLGQLKESAGEPYARLVAFREDEHGLDTKERDELLDLLASAGREVTHRLAAESVAEPDACLLSEVSEEGADPVWMDALTPMLGAAESIVHWIVHTVDVRLLPGTVG